MGIGVVAAFFLIIFFDADVVIDLTETSFLHVIDYYILTTSLELMHNIFISKVVMQKGSN